MAINLERYETDILEIQLKDMPMNGPIETLGLESLLEIIDIIDELVFNKKTDEAQVIMSFTKKSLANAIKDLNKEE